MRARTVFHGTSVNRSGNWSEAEVILIGLLPAPTAFQVSSPQFFVDVGVDEIILGFSMDLQWSPGARRKRQTSLTPTGYQVAVGTEPIEVPFGEVHMDTVTEVFVSRIFVVDFQCYIVYSWTTV